MQRRGGGLPRSHRADEQLCGPPGPGRQRTLRQRCCARGCADAQRTRQCAECDRLLRAVRTGQHKGGLLLLDDEQQRIHALRTRLDMQRTVRRRRLAQELLLLVLVGEERDGQHHRQQQKQRQPEAVSENSAVGTHNPHSPSKDYAYSVGRKGRAYTLL